MSDIFNPTTLAKAVHDTLDEAFATIPEGRTNVLIIDGSYSKEEGAAARLLWARKVGEGWNIVTQGSVDRDHGLGGKIATVKSW